MTPVVAATDTEPGLVIPRYFVISIYRNRRAVRSLIVAGMLASSRFSAAVVRRCRSRCSFRYCCSHSMFDRAGVTTVVRAVTLAY